ncbi:MAG: tetratricopeptide repeat-containing sensor histidine kinase, partial [Flavobacterium sp.]
AGCQKERERNDPLHQTISSFVNTYDYYLADSIALSKVDSIGELVLALPNSRANREIIKDFIDKTKPKKKYSEHLFKYSLDESDSINMANSYFFLGKYYEQRLIYDSSYSYYCLAENIYLSARDSLKLSRVLYSKSVVLSMNGVFSEAETQILQSVKYNTKNTSLEQKLYQYSLLGNIFSGLGMLDDAVYFYKQAINIVDSKEVLSEITNGVLNLNRVYLYTNLSRIYVSQGKYDTAREILENITANYIDFSNYNSERYYAYVAIDMADIMIKQDDISEVYPILMKAYNIGIKNKNRVIRHRSVLGLIEYYFYTNQVDLAMPLLEKVQKEVRDVGDFRSQLKALELLMTYTDNNSTDYFMEYMEISKLFKGQTYWVKNNFVRLKDEVDVLTQVNRSLNQTNRYITLIGAGLLFILMCVILFYVYQSKIRKVGLSKMFQRDTEHYYNSIINIQNSLALVKDRERGMIAKELNDGVINRLFAARFSLVQLEDEQISHQKDLLVNEIIEVEKYIRAISHTIVNEEIIQIQKFEQLLGELVLMQKKQSLIDFTIQFDQKLDLEKLSHRKKINIYRSIQEALINVHLHSSAHSCKIVFTYKSTTSFEVRIADDGIGFDTRSIKKGYGLLHIKERLAMIKGKLVVNSRLEKGTTYLFIISS